MACGNLDLNLKINSQLHNLFKRVGPLTLQITILLKAPTQIFIFKKKYVEDTTPFPWVRILQQLKRTLQVNCHILL
jgi:hypothetical protein